MTSDEDAGSLDDRRCLARVLCDLCGTQLQSLIGNNTLASVADWAGQVRPERDEAFGWRFLENRHSAAKAGLP